MLTTQPVMELAEAFNASRGKNGSHLYNQETLDARKKLESAVQALVDRCASLEAALKQEALARENVTAMRNALQERLIEAEKQDPVAWYVERQAPGMRDHGRKMGPFWKKVDAEEWCDNNHTLHKLYGSPVSQEAHTVPVKRSRMAALSKALGDPGQLAALDGETADDALLELAATKLEQAEQQEPVYQFTTYPGQWVDMTKEQYEKVKGSKDVRIVYAAPVVAEPAGQVLMPLKPTKEMLRVMAQEDWEWHDLIEAVGVTEEQYEIASQETFSVVAPQAQEQDLSAANNFGKPYGYAVVVATGKDAGMLDGGAYTFRNEAEKVIKDHPNFYDNHKVVLLYTRPESQPPEQDNPHGVEHPNETADHGHDNSVSSGLQTPYYCAKCREHMGDTDSPENVPERKYAVCWKCQKPKQSIAPQDSYDAIWNALQRIESAAVLLPTFQVAHEGGIDAVTQNIVDAITAAAPQPQAQGAMPDCWVVVKDGKIFGAHDEPCQYQGIQAVRYVPAIEPHVAVQWLAEMIMSDCGCSTNNMRLLERIIERIQKYERANAVPTAQQADETESVRIYDYVWPQRSEHKDGCIYACSYTPGNHLARGELLAVVHPSQLKNAYLQRDGEPAHGIGVQPTSQAAQSQENKLVPVALPPYYHDRLKDFVCKRVENAGGTSGLTLFMTKLGAHSEYQLYDGEALALWTNMGIALGNLTGAVASPVAFNFEVAQMLNATSLAQG